jgi:hypothetical protein
MYYDQGGEIYKVETNNGEFVAVNLPPKPPKSKILFSHFPKKDQYWRRTELPTFKATDIEWWSSDEPEDPYEEIDWEVARREEIIKQTGCDPWNVDRSGNPKVVKGVKPDPDYYIDVMEDFRSQEIDRVLEGVWFMNNGKATYITGLYYFFLSWWKMDVGYGTYREPDKEKHYIAEYVKQSPVDFGFLDFEGRGTGKSVQAGSASYVETITKKNAFTGIQSKTEDDAEAFFKRKIVESYKDLPDFLIPINKNGSSPTKNLDFSAPSRSGKNAAIDRKRQREALRSVLDYRNSKETAYDGETLSFLLSDEFGKTTESNVYKRWEVNRQCLYRDGRKRGWSWHCTTVEEMEAGGGMAAKDLWEASNPAERNENGRTKSWLIRYFRPSSKSANFDKYGFPDVEKNLAMHEAEKRALENDPDAYIAYVQKNPETIDEAFAMSSGNCPYNAAILQRVQMKLISPEKNFTVRGDFDWKNGEKDTSVVFVPNPANGMWEISWMDIEDNCNRVNIIGQSKDANGHQLSLKDIHRNRYRTMAYDPTSIKKVIDKKKQSDAAAAVFQKTHDVMRIEEDHLETFVADFSGRYPDPDMANEQILMGCVFFGSYILIEDNKDQAIKYFQNRGYGKILMKTKNASGRVEKVGISGSTHTINYYVTETKSYINRFGSRLKHIRIVQDWLSFDPLKTTKYDSGVAASYAIIGAENTMTEVNETQYSVTDFFSTTNQMGRTGK